MEKRFEFKYLYDEKTLYTAVKVNDEVYVIVWKDSDCEDGYESVVYLTKLVEFNIEHRVWILT